MPEETEMVRLPSDDQTTTRRPPTARVWALVAASVVVALLSMVGATTLLRGETLVRQVEIIAQNMHFNQTNPPIVAQVGERVEVMVQNTEDRPLAHDFSVPAFGSKTSFLQPGQSETVSFMAKRAGTFKYACTLHPGAMNGLVIIQGQ